MCGRYSLFFDDEYDYDIAKMMDILKQKYLFNLPEHRTLYMAGFYSFFYLFQFPPLRKDKVCRADSLTTYSYQRTFQSNLQLFEYYTFFLQIQPSIRQCFARSSVSSSAVRKRVSW